MWARIHLIPVLQAEEDRDQVRRMLADKAREKELLGSETKVYHTDRWATKNPTLMMSRMLTRQIDSSDRRSQLRLVTSRNRVLVRLLGDGFGRGDKWKERVNAESVHYAESRDYRRSQISLTLCTQEPKRMAS